MNNYQDFGFNSNEFLGELTTIPYCQFLNASSKNYGLAITSANAELAKLKLTDGWKPIEHEFADGTNETLLVTQQPRLLILNRSQPLMIGDTQIMPYNKTQFAEGGFKAFSYAVVWFLDQNNQPISELPFRLKCSGYAGLTFLKNYSYYNNPNSFCKKFLQVYKTLTGDRAIDKNEVFYAHAVYQPILTRQKATSSINGQSSFAVMTDRFLEPNRSNFASLIVKNGSSVSNKIKELIETTKPWLETELVHPQADNTESEPKIEVNIHTPEPNGIEAGLTPEPIAF